MATIFTSTEDDEMLQWQLTVFAKGKMLRQQSMKRQRRRQWQLKVMQQNQFSATLFSWLS